MTNIEYINALAKGIMKMLERGAYFEALEDAEVLVAELKDPNIPEDGVELAAATFISKLFQGDK